MPVTSLHYKQMKRKQTEFESRYNATITQQKKDFPNSSTNKSNERKISFISFIMNKRENWVEQAKTFSILKLY